MIRFVTSEISDNYLPVFVFIFEMSLMNMKKRVIKTSIPYPCLSLLLLLIIIIHAQTPVGRWYTNGSLNLGPKTTPYNNQQKKENLQNNQQKKENLQNCRLCCPGKPQNKTERMWREISTLTLLENWKNYGTWEWQLYQLWLVLLAR